MLVVGPDAFATQLIRRSPNALGGHRVAGLEQPSGVVIGSDVTAVTSAHHDVDRLAALRRGRLRPLPGVGHLQATDIAIVGPREFFWVEQDPGPSGFFALKHVHRGAITTVYRTENPLSHLTLTGASRKPLVTTSVGDIPCLRLAADEHLPLPTSDVRDFGAVAVGMVGSPQHDMVAIGYGHGLSGVVWDVRKDVTVTTLPTGWRPLAWRNTCCLLADGARLLVVDVERHVKWELPSAPDYVYAAAWEQ
jgi:hypothetical protein